MLHLLLSKLTKILNFWNLLLKLLNLQIDLLFEMPWVRTFTLLCLLHRLQKSSDEISALFVTYWWHWHYYFQAFWRRWPTRSSWSRRWIESCASAKQRNKICEVIKRFQYPLLIIFLFRCLFLSIFYTQFWYFNIEQSFFQQFLQQCCEWWRRSKTKIAAVYLEHENHLF